MPGIWESLFGTSDQFKQLPIRNQQQLATQSQLGQNISPLLQGLMGNKFDFGPIEEQARSNYASKTVPLLSERFSAMMPGSQGGQRSSAFQAAQFGGGANLERDLASLKSQYGLQQQGQQQNLLSLLLGYQQNPSFENIFMPGRQGAFGGLSQGVGQGLGAALPYALMAGLTGGASLPFSGLAGLSSMFGNSQNNQQQVPYALSGGFGNQNFARQFGQSRFF